MLSLHSISIKKIYPSIEVNLERFKNGNSDLDISGKKIAFGIDSFEDYFIDKSMELKQFKDVRDSIYVETKYPDFV